MTTGSSFTLLEDDHSNLDRKQVAEDKNFDEVALSITDFERYTTYQYQFVKTRLCRVWSKTS